MPNKSAAKMASDYMSKTGFNREVRGAMSLSLPKGNFSIMPAGCIHWPLTNMELFQEWINRVQETGSYVFLVGDSFDFARSHYREFLRTYSSDESSAEAIDEWHLKDIGALAKMLLPIEDRILGLVRGNHHHVFSDGTNSEQALARLLGTYYLGAEGAVRLDVGDETIVVYLHHDGGGRGGTIGSDVNTLIKAAGVINPDAVICAHTHRAFAFKEPQHEVARTGDARVVSKDRAFMRVGCFKDTREATPTNNRSHIANYRAVRAYRPVQDGWTELSVEFRPAGRRFFVRS